MAGSFSNLAGNGCIETSCAMVCIPLGCRMMLVGILLWLSALSGAHGSIISSSEIQMCSRTSKNVEPLHPMGEACSKKFVVSLALQSGQVSY